jgi:hypothetical protein
VDIRMVKAKIANPLVSNGNCKGTHSLWDIYPSAEFVSYPSLCEGFGNALLEAVYFKKPLLVNRYRVFSKDIEPKGFNFAVMDGFLSKNAIRSVREILRSPARQQEMASHNYEVASRHYSYAVLDSSLSTMIDDLFSEATRQYPLGSQDQSNIRYLHKYRPQTENDSSYYRLESSVEKNQMALRRIQ